MQTELVNQIEVKLKKNLSSRIPTRILGKNARMR